MAIISKGITLSYKVAGTEGELITLTNLMEIPELGGDTESVEITTLSDAAHMYIDGIDNYGDAITFKFLFEAEQFKTLNGLDKAREYQWRVTFPNDVMKCDFYGTPSVKLDGVGVNAALTYTLNIKPTDAMVFSSVGV